MSVRNRMAGIYEADEIVHQNMRDTQVCINGGWFVARPMHYWSFGRFRAAWMVLTMKADAIVWRGQ